MKRCILSYRFSSSRNSLFQIAEQKAADKERKAKYVDNMLKASRMRKINEQSVQERQQQKEREKEGDQFADKEVRRIFLKSNSTL